MANFRVYPGLYVKFTADVKSSTSDESVIKAGEVHQVMAIEKWSNLVSFPRIPGLYNLSGNVEPIYEKRIA